MISEKQIQDDIINYFRSSDYLIERFNLGAIIYKRKRITNQRLKGFPDLFGVLKKRKGHLFVIEVKREGQHLSKEQEEWKIKLEKRGVAYVLARSLEGAIKAVYKLENA